MFKGELAWARDKWCRIFSNIYNVILNSYTTKKLKNKAVLILYVLLCSPYQRILIVLQYTTD